MSETLSFPHLAIRLRTERHVVQARQRARELAALLGFEHQEQIRLATAASELARNAFRYAAGGTVDFLIRPAKADARQLFLIAVSDSGQGIPNLDEVLSGRYVSRTGMGKGLSGTQRLMEFFDIHSDSSGTRVECGKYLPITTPAIDAARIKSVTAKLVASGSADPFEEIERQNQELLKTLAELKEKQDQLADLNRELEDTNRGVVALYAELEQHADDLRRVSDLKTSFLSNLSHEFRTPLNSIASLSRLLLGRTDGDLAPEQEKQVIYIRDAAAELSVLVNDLLDLAKVEAGKVDVRTRSFHIADLFGALRGMLRPLLAVNHLELLFEADPNLPPLITDEGKVSQILRNLISNALKFTRKGHIRVSARIEPAGFAVFEVADTGIGIAPEDLDRIFEEFVQIESELQAEVKGTGLGLPLSRRLAQLLGGTLEVASIPGTGSTFTLRLPARIGPATQPMPLPQSAADPARPAVLFIEDNRETSFVHQASMRTSSYRSQFVPGLDEAREALRNLNPALIVLDRMLGEQDSLHFIPELRRSGYSGPLLVVSVLDDAASALAAGADRFLAKPIPPFTLVNTVRELVEGRSSKTILLVDDDEVTRYLVGGELARLGFRIIEAHGGREALSLLNSEQPDSVVLDIAMPDMNGFEVLREIRSRGFTSMPIIIHSSRDFSAEERQTLAAAHALLFPKQAFTEESRTLGLLHILEQAGMA